MPAQYGPNILSTEQYLVINSCNVTYIHYIIFITYFAIEIGCNIFSADWYYFCSTKRHYFFVIIKPMNRQWRVPLHSEYTAKEYSYNCFVSDNEIT